MSDKKESVGNRIGFIGFCIAGAGYFFGAYVYREIGAIIIGIGCLLAIFGILRTWRDLFFGDD